MKKNQITFKEANEYIKWILLVGLALGIANFSLGIWNTLGQSIIQQITISFVIGYGLLLVIYNSPQFFPADISEFKKNGMLLLCFCLIGVIGSEVEFLVKRFFFQQGEYSFLNGGGIYLFNAILTSVLGFGTQTWFSTKDKIKHLDQQDVETSPSQEMITTVPIRQGENIVLYPLEEVIYFEAYDNYSFLFDLEGKKQLCNYSLLLLEKKLVQNFARVHRKYLINKTQIAQIKPHLKGRYIIEFKDKKRSVITSSSSYTEVIKSMIKL